MVGMYAKTSGYTRGYPIYENIGVKVGVGYSLK